VPGPPVAVSLRCGAILSTPYRDRRRNIRLVIEPTNASKAQRITCIMGNSDGCELVNGESWGKSRGPQRNAVRARRTLTISSTQPNDGLYL
jgi:hypothetical protein